MNLTQPSSKSAQPQFTHSKPTQPWFSSALSGKARQRKELARLAQEVVAKSHQLDGASGAELRLQAETLAESAHTNGYGTVITEGLALAHQLCIRHLGMTPYEVQVSAAIVLLRGSIAQMATGEGKTLVAVLAGFVFGLEGRGAHIVTPNDYLAERDGTFATPLFEAAGFTVGTVTEATPIDERKSAYAATVTYAADAQVVFDYLKDHTFATRRDQQVQRSHFAAIVDEVDAVLLDHARTPLILSSLEDLPMTRWRELDEVTADLEAGLHVTVDTKERLAYLTEEGIDEVEAALGLDSTQTLFDSDMVEEARIIGHLLTARFVFEEGRDYIIQDVDGNQQAVIIDATTGRVLVDTVWTDGLHQAVEIIQGLDPRPEQHTWARITYQAFFRRYEHLSGMSGTAITEADEFATAFDLHCVDIPTNRPLVRVDAPDRVFANESAKLQTLVEDVVQAHRSDRPVLIGCRSVQAAEQLASQLSDAGIFHRVLTARTPQAEAEVIAQAGTPGAVTVSTAMAGRGTDILLGGDPHRIADKFIESSTLVEGSAAAAAHRAERVKRCADDAERVRQVGGLLVIGAERFEARRIDNQLRGRAGRQGDPGESRFYVSAEDEMVALFGPTASLIASVLPKDSSVSSRSITKMVERAQRAMEGRDVSARAQLMRWDVVLDAQRDEFYRARDSWLVDPGLWEYINDTQQIFASLVVNTLLASELEDFDRRETLATDVLDSLGLDPAHLHASTVDNLQDLLIRAADFPETSQEVIEFAGSLLAERLEAVLDSLGGRNTQELVDLVRTAVMAIADHAWRAHLAFLDHLRAGVKLRATLGSDPVFAWVKEAEEAWEHFHHTIAVDSARALGTLHGE